MNEQNGFDGKLTHLSPSRILMDLIYMGGVLPISSTSLRVPTLPSKLYRILRQDEHPYSIVAKNSNAQKTVLSHVNYGGRKGYESQFISTSASLEAAKKYKKEGEKKGLTGLRIGEIEVDKLPENCQIIDLTTEENRDRYLGKAVCKNFAKASQEVLLQCDVPIRCTVIDPPSLDQLFGHLVI